MPILTGDKYLESLVKFVENQADTLIEGSLVLKLNPVGLRYVQSRLEALQELESLLVGAPVDYLRAYVSDLGDHRALEQLRKILHLLPSLKVVSLLPPLVRDPTPLNLRSFARLKVLELRGCDLSTSAAKGLLELRFTLEKLICHNSTDALRHVFTSRIADVKDSPQWNRLLFVSCACNGLVLMDDSLQLLPVVEFLDLSRNKFAKIDNLSKCTKLKHVDLGFNSLRSIASFSEACCQIEKLVLRNNALMSLHGVENLKSLQDLDLSYNIISSFSEIERLSGLPALQNLWLEGNPLCYARWFRAQLFSLFPHVDQLKLDEKKISSSEFWKRNIIIASRRKQPASFGFYKLATDDADAEGGINTKRKRASRLASIKNDEQIDSDEDSLSCDNETNGKEEDADADEEAEIEGLMKRIEFMKKDDSISWLNEFKEWMDQTSQDVVDGKKSMRGSRLHSAQEIFRDTVKKVDVSNHYGDESTSSNPNLESGTSFANTSTVASVVPPYMDQIGESDSRILHVYDGNGISISKEYRAHHEKYSAVVRKDGVRSEILVSISTAINDIMRPQTLSASMGSPPHYQEDILHRRNNFQEEFMQLSVDSYSLPSSESSSSCSIDDLGESGAPEIHHNGFFIADADAYDAEKAHEESTSCVSSHYPEAECSINHRIGGENNVAAFSKVNPSWMDHKKYIHKTKRSAVCLREEIDSLCDAETSKMRVGNSQKLRDDLHDAPEILPLSGMRSSTVANGDYVCHRGIISGSGVSITRKDSFINTYFSANLACSNSAEIASQHVFGNILFSNRLGICEREVAVVRSSKQKLYIWLIDSCKGSDSSLEIIGSHALETVREISVGLGLQVMRVSFEGNAVYIFVTRCSRRSGELLCVLGLSDSFRTNLSCSFTNLEQAQVHLLEKHVRRGPKTNIWLYSMVLFSSEPFKENGTWSRKSLFVLEQELLLCTEDLTQWTHLDDDGLSPDYLLPDSRCPFKDISEMVVEEHTRVVTIRQHRSELTPLCCILWRKTSTWRLKWFCSDSLLRFVSLIKAIYAQATSSSLPVRYHERSS